MEGSPASRVVKQSSHPNSDVKELSCHCQRVNQGLLSNVGRGGQLIILCVVSPRTPPPW